MMGIKSRFLATAIVAVLPLLPNAACAQDVYSQPQPPQLRVTDDLGVNLLSANWQFPQPVKLSSDIDPDLYFQVSTSNGGFSQWSTSLTGYLSADLSTAVSRYHVVIGQQSYNFTTTNGSNVWTDDSVTGNALTINPTTGIFTFTNRNGVQYLLDGTPYNVQPPGAYQSCVAGAATNSYNVCAVVTSIKYPDGKLITLSYEGMATLISTGNYRTYVRLKSARSSNGISIKVAYATDQTTSLTDWLNLSSATLINDAYEFCNYSTGSCSAQYSWPTVTYSSAINTLPDGSTYRKTTVTDQLGIVHTYDSVAHGYRLVIYKSGVGAPPALTYLNDQGPNTRGEPNPPDFADVTDADGRLYQYRYNNVRGPNGSYYEIHGTRTSSDGRVISFVGNRQIPQSTVISSLTDEVGNTASFLYDSYLRPIEVDFPETNATLYSYDARGNVTSSTQRPKSGSGLSDVTRYATYATTCSAPAACNKPLTVGDNRGNVTAYSWDQTTGAMISATSPADGAGLSAVKRFAYTSMYARVSDGAGGYTPTGSPRSMLTEMRTCKSTATVGNGCAGGTADEIVTSYYYGPQTGPNNLQLRGMSVTADGATVTACYAYDRLGNRISETQPKANIQVCP